MIRIGFNLHFFLKRLTHTADSETSQKTTFIWTFMTAVGHGAFGRDIQCLKSDIFAINFV